MTERCHDASNRYDAMALKTTGICAEAFSFGAHILEKHYYLIISNLCHNYTRIADNNCEKCNRNMR